MKNTLETEYAVGHSPLPWIQVVLHPSAILGAGQISYQSFSIQPDSFFAQNHPVEAKKIAEANAELIVRSVNAHDDMLSALNKVKAHYPPQSRLSHDESELLEIVNAAIAKAEGRDA